VVEFVKGEDYAKFTRIVFDTAPTGHTLRLLSVPDFVDAALGKIVRLRKKLGSAGDAVRGLFGASDQQDTAVEKLEKLRVSALSLKQGAGSGGLQVPQRPGPFGSPGPDGVLDWEAVC
jgi:arsenite/tail-anchored protein-transporting ATPase